MEVRVKILRVCEVFGMKAGVAAKAMGVTRATFGNKKSLKVDEHSFNQKNYDDLVRYIKEKAAEL